MCSQVLYTNFGFVHVLIVHFVLVFGFWFLLYSNSYMMSTFIGRFKAGPYQRWRAYWVQLAGDYSAALRECLDDCRRSPLKAGCCLSGVCALIYSYNTTPDLRDFDSQLNSSCARLRLLYPARRRPDCESYVRQLRRWQCQNRLYVVHVGVVSLLLCRRPYAEHVALSANHSPLFWPWSWMARAQLLDIGALGCWCGLRYHMRDYDVNDLLLPDR